MQLKYPLGSVTVRTRSSLDRAFAAGLLIWVPKDPPMAGAERNLKSRAGSDGGP